jgi:hypothetical protein
VLIGRGTGQISKRALFQEPGLDKGETGVIITIQMFTIM